MKKFLEDLQSNGIYTFSKELVRKQLNISESALKKTLQRYEKKGRILKLRKKFYLIIPLEYKKIGILPPFWFIDDLMKYLKLQYYVGLISAANVYGASHQQPQIFQVITNKQMSPIKVKQLQIDFITKMKFPEEKYLESKKSETGILKVSSPELTCFDLVKYIKQSGGINQAVSLILQLKDLIDDNKLLELAKNQMRTVYIQRLGYVFQFLNKEKKAIIFKKALNGKRIYPVLLVPDKNKKFDKIDNQWKVLINYEIEVENI